MPEISGTQEAEAETSQVCGQPGLHSEFEGSHGDLVRPCLKIKF
jgi:hypothetical protein